MRVCIVAEGQEGIGWSDWLALARRCEELGFEALFRSDHYRSTVGVPDRDCLDAWATLAALAGDDRAHPAGHARLAGDLPPPLRARQGRRDGRPRVGGKVELGLGAGWFEEEHQAFGFAFPAIGERNARFREQLEIIRLHWLGEPFDYAGEHYRLQDCRALPRPLQRPAPPIVIGGSGGRGHRRGGCPPRGRVQHAVCDPCRVPRAARSRAGGVRGRGSRPRRRRVLAHDRLRDRERPRRPAAARSWRDAPQNGGDDVDAFLASHRDDWIVGTVEEAAARIAEYAAVGVERLYLQHLDFTDDQTLELVARELVPLVTPL